MSYETILYEKEDRIATITLNRPDKFNTIRPPMPEEIEPIVSKLDDVKQTVYGANTYYEGSYNGQEVVVAYSKIGKVFATMTATMLIEKFGCEKPTFSERR